MRPSSDIRDPREGAGQPPTRLRTVDVCKSYVGASGSKVVALDSVSVDVRDQEIVSIIGPSGCGKSSYLSTVAGWLQPDSGVLELDGIPISGPGPDRPICFQSDTAFAWLTVHENVAFGLRAQGLPTESVTELLHRVGLAEFANEYPKALSGGMRKRLELARLIAAAKRRAIVLLDEAFGSVDPPTRISLHLLLRDAVKEDGYSAIVATHDIQESAFLSDRIVVFSERPAHVKTEFRVPFPQNRDATMLGDPEFLSFVAHVQFSAFGLGRGRASFRKEESNAKIT